MIGKEGEMRHRRVHAAVVGAAAVLIALALAGVPGRTVLLGLAVLACPLAMLVMMRQMGHGGHPAGCDRARRGDRSGAEQ